MAKFTDKLGTVWEVEFDLGTLEDIKKDAEVDLDALTGSDQDRDAFGELLVANRGRKLAEILWVICRDQAEKLGIDPDQYFRRFNGPTLEKATIAFLEAFSDLSPRQVVGRTVRQHLPMLMEKTDRAIEAEMKVVLLKAMGNESDSSNGDTHSPVLPASGILDD